MTTLTILPSGVAVEVSDGDTVLFALLMGGAHIRHDCTGKAQCDGCHILVHQGGENLSKIAGPENDRLKQIAGAGPTSRLACQAVVRSGDVTIEVLSTDNPAAEEAREMRAW
jgi:ferredoxin